MRVSLSVARVASVSVQLRESKTAQQRPLSFFGSRFISRAAKTENLFPRSFFAPKQHGNACYVAGRIKVLKKVGPTFVRLSLSAFRARTFLEFQYVVTSVGNALLLRSTKLSNRSYFSSCFACLTQTSILML